MGKGRIFGSIALGLCIAAAASWSGCGNSNDQGISFRALGFFTDSTGTIGQAGTCASLSDTQIIPASAADGGFLGLENNMNQGINLDHVDLSYHVNGSSLVIPNDVFALSVRLGPASGQESSAPKIFQQIVIVSPNIMSFLNDNRSRLPQPPFSMIVLVTATGVADSGDRFVTNRVSYQVLFTDQPGTAQGQCAVPTPTPGESSGGATGSSTPTA
jgi:hypothetical protein